MLESLDSLIQFMVKVFYLSGNKSAVVLFSLLLIGSVVLGISILRQKFFKKHRWVTKNGIFMCAIFIAMFSIINLLGISGATNYFRTSDLKDIAGGSLIGLLISILIYFIITLVIVGIIYLAERLLKLNSNTFSIIIKIILVTGDIYAIKWSFYLSAYLISGPG